jgi:hypothetical protein
VIVHEALQREFFSPECAGALRGGGLALVVMVVTAALRWVLRAASSGAPRGSLPRLAQRFVGAILFRELELMS